MTRGMGSRLPIAFTRFRRTPCAWSRVRYPALYRLEAQGWIKAEWGLSDNNRKARFYRLTAKGRKQLAAELEHWARIAAGVNRVLAHA